MQIHITGRRIRLSPPLRAYVEQKLQKAQKYFNHIIWAQVMLSVEKKAQQAEIVVHAARHTFRALARGLDLYSAVDLASDKIDAQLKKYKERLRNHHKGAHEPTLETPPAPPVRFSIIKQQLTPITREEAANDMERLGQKFRMFWDRSTGHVCVVYRREDESYGLLQAVKKNGR